MSNFLHDIDNKTVSDIKKNALLYSSFVPLNLLKVLLMKNVGHRNYCENYYETWDFFSGLTIGIFDSLL